MPVVHKLSRKGSTPAGAIRRGIALSRNTGHNTLFPSNWTVGDQLARHRKVLTKNRRKLERKVAVPIRNGCMPPALSKVLRASASGHLPNRRSAPALSVSSSRGTPVRRNQLREFWALLDHSVSIPQAGLSSAITPNGTNTIYTKVAFSKRQKFAQSPNTAKSANARKYGHGDCESVGQLMNPSTATCERTVPEANMSDTRSNILPFTSTRLANRLLRTTPQTDLIQQQRQQRRRWYLEQYQKESQPRSQKNILPRQSQQHAKRGLPSNAEQGQRKRRKPTSDLAASQNRVGIMDLPVELMKMVYGNMVLSDVNSLRHTCRHLYDIFENEKKTISLTADFSWVRSSIQELKDLANNAEISKRVEKVVFVDIQPIWGTDLEEQHPDLPSEHVNGYNREKESMGEYHCAARTSQVLRRILNKFWNLRMLEYHAGYLSTTSHLPNPKISLQEALDPSFIDAMNDNIVYQRRLRAYGGPLFRTPEGNWAETSIRNFHRMISYVLDNRHRKGPLDVKITTTHYRGIATDRRCRQRLPPSKAHAFRSLEICYRSGLGPSCDWLTMTDRGNGLLRSPGLQFDGLEELTLIGNPKAGDHFNMVSPMQKSHFDNTFVLLLPNLKKLTLVNVSIGEKFVAWAKERRTLDILLKGVVVEGGGMVMLKQDPALHHIKTVKCVARTQKSKATRPNPKASPSAAPDSPKRGPGADD